MAAGNSYPAVALDQDGRVVDSQTIIQFTDAADQPSRSGGGSQPGVWKDYATAASNPGLQGITVGNGTLVARWWTPAAVVAALATDPFLCTVYFRFTLGSTSAVIGAMQANLPEGVDGSAFNMSVADVASLDAPPGMVIASLGDGGAFSTFVGLNGGLKGWDDTNPGTWAEGDTLIITATFQASFYEPD